MPKKCICSKSGHKTLNSIREKALLLFENRERSSFRWESSTRVLQIIIRTFRKQLPLSDNVFSSASHSEYVSKKRIIWFKASRMELGSIALVVIIPPQFVVTMTSTIHFPAPITTNRIPKQSSIPLLPALTFESCLDLSLIF